MLLDRCLSVTLVYYSQTVGWIKTWAGPQSLADANYYSAVQ